MSYDQKTSDVSVEKRSGIMSKYRNVISLDGDWSFAYTKNEPDPLNGEFPSDDMYETALPVPSYWDDCKDRLKYTKFWSRDVRFNPDAREIEEFPIGSLKPPDASLPYITGTGWYKKEFTAEEEWSGKSVILNIGGAMLDAWIWVNGQYAGKYYSCGRPIETDISELIKAGSENELLIAVSNLRNNRMGCSIRGYKGRSGGINRSVSISITDKVRITDCHVRPNETLGRLIWDISVDKKTDRALFLNWKISDPSDNTDIAAGEVQVCNDELHFETERYGLRPWSDRDPKLYKLSLTLTENGRITDGIEQKFGMRYTESIGTSILVNGEPTFLRGTTDHAYFPETCTVTNDFSYYIRTLKAIKDAGFNWVRFHTTVPPEECMEAADMLGMYIQAETQNGFSEDDFTDMILLCRRHPSVILYCCGNEVPIDETMLEKMEKMGDVCHALVPECLYDPMEALLKVECFLDKDEKGYTSEPYEHNKIKLDKMREFSDVFATAVWVFSYHSLFPDIDYINRKMSIYKRPCLIHEAGIFDTYLNLDLEERYENTRIGKRLFSAVRDYAAKEGVLEMAPTYYRNSCRWMKLLMKFALEKSRRCPSIAGYDFLGAIDCHWHRTGYAVGVMNEFYELKAGFTLKELQQFNGESIIVSDIAHDRSLYCGEIRKVKLFSSLYGGADIEHGILSWYLTDDANKVRESGRVEVSDLKNGELCELAEIEVGTDTTKDTGEHVRLMVTLSGGIYNISNEWDFWIFNRRNCAKADSYRVTESLTDDDVEYMKNGGRVILMGAGPFPGAPITFQITPGGRTGGNCATVIHDHPIMREFPHEGFCDWQFAPMFHDGGAVQFNDLDIEFKPIIEIVSTYKLIRKQAALFELRVGNGGLIVCTLNLKTNDPAAEVLTERIKEYASSELFKPETELAPEKLIDIMRNRKNAVTDFTTDECYDTGGYIEV